MNTLFKIMLGMVVLAPLPLGAAYMWTWSLMALIVAGLLVGWAVLLYRSGQGPAITTKQIWPVLLFFILVIVWAFIQISGWTPASWHQPLWSEAEHVSGRKLQGAISLNPFEGGSAILRLLTYAGIFWLALQLCRDRERARQALKVVAVAGIMYAAYGLIIQLFGLNLVLWYQKTDHRNVVTSTFLNRNTYATYAGLGLILVTAYLVDFVEKRLPNSESRRDTIRDIVLILTVKARTFVAGWILLLSAVLLTQSRGGTISTIAAMMVFLICLSFRQNGGSKRTRGTLATLFVAVLLLTTASGGKVMDRIEDAITSGDVRMTIYGNTLRAIKDNAATGVGYGAFADAYRIYRGPVDRGAEIELPVIRAHNTYLENILELGLPAALLLFSAVITLLVYCVGGIFRRHRDGIYPCIGVGSISLIAVHSIFDFSVQVPAVGVMFAFILGLASAQSWNTVRNR